MMGEFVQCVINYGLEVTTANRSLDFKSSMGGPEKQATLRVGLYSLTALAQEVARAMSDADGGANIYTVSVDRTIGGGAQNRVTIETDGAYLDLLFATGTRTASTCATLLGFNVTDRTGATSYNGNNTAGEIIVPTYPPYDLQQPGTIHDARRSLNETTSGFVETVSFSTFRNFQFKIRYMAEDSAEFAAFQDFHIWLLRGGPIEFAHEITDPTDYAAGIPINLRTPIELNRMLPGHYDYFETPVYTFREVI
jgi:hypothetical protein